MLALIRREKGADVVERALPDSMMSIVNVAEVVSKSVERGNRADDSLADIQAMGVTIVPFELDHCLLAAELRAITVSRGLSLGDRVCLALAAIKDCPVLTSDQAWASLPHGVRVSLVR